MPGIKSFKDMFSSESDDPAAVDNAGDPGTSASGNADATTNTGTSKSGRKFFGKRTSLPPGTGPGTSGLGHPVEASELAMQSDLERSKAGQSTSGYGTDAAAAMGGTLAGTHQGIGIDRTAARNSRTVNGAQVTSTQAGGQALPVTYTDAGELGSDTEGAMRGTRTTDQSLGAAVLEEGHPSGQYEHRDIPFPKPAESKEHRSILRPIVHSRVRRIENEEVAYVQDTERHSHHVQHHTHPIFVTEESQEQLRKTIRSPIIHEETHSTSKPKDRAIFEEQIYKHRDSVSHVPKERIIINKGTTVNVTKHHHIHHIIQPVIEKEIIEKERIHATVPVRQVIHDAPVIHQMRSHTPISMQHFLDQFGSLDGVSQDEIVKEILDKGKRVREEGAADFSGDTNLVNKNVQGTTAHTNLNNIGPIRMDEDHGVLSKSGTQRTVPLIQTTVLPVPSRP